MAEGKRAKTVELPWWLPEQVLVVSVLVCLGPGALGVLLANHGRLLLGLGLLGLWVAPYSLLLLLLHRRNLVRLAVSGPCTVAVLVAVFFIS